MSLCVPACKIARFQAELKSQDGLSVAKRTTTTITTPATTSAATTFLGL